MSEAAWGRRPPTRLGIRPSVTLCQIDGRAVADTQFLKSMIPHHAGAILMCEKAPISGADIKELCQKIIASQRSEIAQMKRMLSAAGN
jgi:uncharacterized protein (DUF305 family)